MLTQIKYNKSQIYSGLIGLFFILILQFKLSYSLIPILLALSGIALLIPHIKNKSYHLAKSDKWLITTFVCYFLLFVVSLIVHKGKGSELDLAARALLALPILAVFYKNQLKQRWIVYAILIAGIGAGITSMIQVFGFDFVRPFPKIMHIQAGDIAMSLAMFSFCTLFYFYTQKQRIAMYLSLIAALFALIASFLTTARGAWIGVPFVLFVIFWLNRKSLSKWLISGVLLITLTGGIFTSETIHKRYLDAQSDINAYVDGSNKSTSVGARFDMWKSAVIGIQEKPLFGWGIQGVKEMRKQHFAEGKISKYAASFGHAHNQYLHDASTRGIVGLIALLATLFVPLILFWNGLKQSESNSLAHLWGVLGITHILLMMSYFLTQAFLSHNSGAMFYFITTVIFLGLQKNALIRPLMETK
ncbi:O-antigen ligase family protein [Actinobacillus equuli]|uniref:O-antigen ligase family protein n=1 Tax=Actinobacillus equuli TaxID=718 RepID=UPI00244227A9|nr:O-antigen ligase [Actinobacillus equuli]WGE41261.1 O-antigen ligase family protein [Actinobacillus equuli subsp. haemolyticus]WGE58277.1 O-antigen ligase family protein [Actinobacillus equuli subsp. haemolyticus]